MTRSILAVESLRQLVAREYDVGKPHACTFIGPTKNDHYLVETDDGRFVLRVYCAGRRRLADIVYELDALVHLWRADAPVAFPTPGRDGALSRRVEAPEGERNVVLFSYTPGKPAGRDLPDERLGRLGGGVLADLHQASDDFRTPNPRSPLDLEWLLEQPLRRIESYLKYRSDDWDYLTRLGKRLRGRIMELSPGLSRGFCHGDFHGWSVHVAEDGSATVFDFDWCGPGWRAYDLATFWHNLGPGPAKSATWRSFLQGYTERRRLSETDVAAVTPLAALCELWVMGGRAARVSDWGILWLDDRMDRGIRFLKRWKSEMERVL